MAERIKYRGDRMFFFGKDNDSKRTLGIRDKQIIYRNAKGKCENPACGKKIDFDEMQVGHKNAWSRGGRTTFSNSVCLCYRCNKLQGTDSWIIFLKKQGIEDPKTKLKIELKKSLETLNVKQLKLLAAKHHVAVKGDVEEDRFETRRFAPTKRQYINKLSGIVTEKELSSIHKDTPTKVKRKRV